MKKLLPILCLLALIGCSDVYDDSGIRADIEDLKERVTTLEEMCREMNSNISAMQSILTALQNNDYITSVTPVTEGGKTIGYTITFAKGNPITIYHGTDGKDGQDGENGKDGQNGADGKDGYTPVIGVKQDADGIYYWTLDGEWLTDENGNRIKAVGTDGKDGANGQDGVDGENGKDGTDGADGKDGKDGITPLLKIENDYWYISYDNGTTWTQLGKATGDKGEQGEQGPQGDKGDKGDKGDVGLVGDSMFADVDYSNDEYVIFTLSNGTSIQVPTWYAFEQLRTLCNQMNSNIEALQTIVAALQNNDYVTKVEPVLDNGATIGYTIYFSKSNPVTIYHGKDGENGKDGQDGQDGADGKDGYTPVIGVKQDADGIYYWTLDGEWLTDENGNRIKAVGTDGKDGEDGVDGENGKDGADGATGPQGPQGEQGITPLLKIEDDYWYVSYDNGQSWTQLGKATGEKGEQGEQGPQGDKGETGAQGPQGESGANGDSFFQSVTQDEQYVYFTLADGTVITLPKGAALDITFEASDLVVMSPNSTREINYTVQSVTDKVTVEVTSSADIRAKVVTSDASGKTGKIKITTGATIDEYSKVIVFVSNGDKVIMKSILFEEGAIIVQNDYSITFPIEGGSESISFLTNVGFQIKIPDDCTWLTYTQTRSFVEHAIVITASQNDSYEQRYTQIKLIDTESGNIASATIEVIQQCIHISEAVEGEILVQRKGGKVKVKKELQTETIAIPIESEWVKLDVETDDAFYLDISPNSQNEYRQADIKIIGQSGEAIVKILQPGIKYTLQITHTNSTYYIPQVTWDTNSEYLSFISWGDKSINKYTPMSYHEYSNSEEYQQLELYSNILPEQVVLNNITGVTLIDLTKFQANE